VWIRVLDGIDGAQIANAGCADLGGGEALTEAAARRLHEAAVGWHADRQLDGALGAARFRDFDATQDRRLFARDDHLAWRIEIDGLHDRTLRGLGTGGFDVR